MKMIILSGRSCFGVPGKCIRVNIRVKGDLKEEEAKKVEENKQTNTINEIFSNKFNAEYKSGQVTEKKSV